MFNLSCEKDYKMGSAFSQDKLDTKLEELLHKMRNAVGQHRLTGELSNSSKVDSKEKKKKEIKSKKEKAKKMKERHVFCNLI